METNQKILSEWTKFFQSTVSFCMKKDDNWSLPSMNQVKKDLASGWDGAKRYPVLNDRKKFLQYLTK
ncbi:MAG: hypothetical protein GXP45_04765 [bacterium]|nr:hypothetical protein [bacterium]